MGKIYYSATVPGFCDDRISAELPADAVEINREDYIFLLEKQAAGQVICSDENGYPVLKEPDSSRQKD